MGETTNIAWTEKTWNPWQGCHKVSPGCVNCYMFREKKRYGHNPAMVIRSKKATFNRPLHWKKLEKVFVCSWSDFFIEEADGWRQEAWNIIRACPHLTFQILTKRPENIKDRLPKDWPLKNVWLGVTVENQEQAEKRIPLLLALNTAVKFVSVEPMLGPVDLWTAKYPSPLKGGLQGAVTNWPGGLDWVICGGESGPEARPMNIEWANDLKIQCGAANVPFFMKQMSGKSKKEREAIPDDLFLRQFP